MASQRPGLGPSGLPADSRLKNPGTIAPPGSLLLKKRGGESTTERVRTLPQPKMPSRLPQSLPQRRPSDTQPEPIQPRVTTVNRNSKLFGNTTTITSGSSSRLPAPTLKPRNVLRRKNSGISQEVVNSIRKGSRDETGNHSKTSSSSSASNARSQTSVDSSASSRSERNPTMNTMEIRVAHQVEVAAGAQQAPTLYPELDRYRDVKVPAYTGGFGIEVLYPLTTHDLPPPTPLFSGSSSQMSGFSSSPCTRFSESPGPGPYSRDTTPTSMSSQSPGMVAPLRFPGAGVRMRQVDSTQTRPPVSRRRGGSISNELDLVSADPQGLPSVRESLTSSSSNSTVRELERKDSSKKRKQLSPLAPSPPPRISSHKFTKSHDGSLSPPRPWRAPPTQPAAAATAQLLPKPGSFSRPRPAQTIQQGPPLRGQPPRRPSRDGTPDLHSQLGLPIPVIQSNLTSTPSERRSSKLLAPAAVTRPGLLSSTSDTHVHLLRPAINREATPAPKMSRMVEDASTIKAEPGRTTRTPSPGVSTFRRFPLFGRRTKTAPEVPLQKDEKKPTRKGPAAGTGHEGYGRVGPARRRSNSLANTSRAIPGTMSSQESIGTNDSFLLERMAPVVIAGGEIVENRNVGSELGRTESSQSVTRERPSVESQNSSQASLNPTPRKTLWPSAFPRAAQHAQSASVSSRRPSESSESEAPVIKSTLALRRSIQRLKSGEKEPPRIPAPIVTQAHVTSPSITSIDASVLMTDDSMLAPSIDATQGIKAPEASKNLSGPKRLMKRARSPRKWNFFGRNHSQPNPEAKKVDVPEPMAPVAAVAATVQVVQSKPLAFYTMMDSSEQEDTDVPDLEEVLREAKSPDSPTQKQFPDFQHKESEERRASVTQENTHPGFSASDASAQAPTVAELEHMSPVRFPNLPAPPSLPLPAAPQAPSITAPTQGRPSRLPQVGRIPKVISARAEQISPKSFSRPFHRLSVQATPSKMDLRDAYSIAKGPSPPRPSTPVQMEPTTAVGIEAPVLTQSPGSIIPAYHNQIGKEFLAFSPRKGSQCTTNTTTSSSSGGFNFAEATAIIPEPGAPLAEDEIWDEYDDLFGDETLNQPHSVRSTRSSLGNQFHLEKYTATPTRRIEPPLESPTLRSQFQEQQVQSLTQIMHSERIPVSSSVYSSDMAEKVKQLLAGHPSPRCSLEPEIPEESEMESCTEVASKQPEQVKELETEKQRSSLPINEPRRSDSSGCSQSSEDGSPLALVNLRVGSMTVSKWLTFGHVLFSPVRDELLNDVGSLKRPSILVIDGLGNDDWSFYAAETYPAATFFNLSPRPPRPTARNGATGMPLSPPNHYQKQYMSHTGKFPFGAESFTAVVFRFPAAAPEAHYRNIISEARRVLKPGGYIELSILDVDLNNMGNRGRKAVRRLKERINAKSPDVSLGSTSDLILRLLGRKGFVDLKTCRVGVPVASVIPRSSSSENGKNSKGAGKSKTLKDERSLPEMISDGSPVADESITKMVAKVGRWWYSRCYESAAGTGIGPGTLGSMWRDKALLAECEEWGTSLKLMVCHARVPDGRPRLASI